MKIVNIRLFWLILALIGLPLLGHAQYTVNMVHNQTIYIDACQHPTGTVYDDGGPNGGTPNNFFGTVVISAPSGLTISLTGDYSTERNCDILRVYDGNNATGTLLGQYSGSGNVSLSSNTGYLTLRYTTDGSVASAGFAVTYNILGSSDLCTNPVSHLSLSNLTATSAQAQWQADDNSGPFVLRLNGDPTTVTTNSYLLPNLSPNRRYSLEVCGASDLTTPCCNQTLSFRTLCGDMEPPIEENFDDYGVGYNVIPTCWTKLLNYDDTLNEPQIVGNPTSSSPGALRMYCGSNDDGNHYSMIISPRINVSHMSSLQLRLSLRAAYSGTYIVVGVCDTTTRVGNNFTPVDTLTINNINTWETKLVSLASYTGNGKYLALRMPRSLQTGNGRYIFVDDMSLQPCGIWHQQVYNVNYNTAWIRFDTFGSVTVDLEYGPAGFAAGSGVVLSDVSSPVQLSGLDPATRYDIRLVTSCDGSAPTAYQLSTTTLAPPDNQLSRCYDFASATLPPGWYRTVQYDNAPNFNNAYPGALRMRADRNNYYSNQYSLVALPPIDTVAMASLSVDFKLLSEGSTSMQMVVGVMEYPSAPESFVPVDTVDVPTLLTYYPQHVSLRGYSGSGRYLAFKCQSPTSNGTMYLSDLRIGLCAVSNVQVSQVTNRSARVTWDTLGADFHGSSLTLEYGLSGFAEGSGTTVTITDLTTTHHTLTGLLPGTIYDYYLYGNCDTSDHHCANVRSFRTLESSLLPAYCQSMDEVPTNALPEGWAAAMSYYDCPRVVTFNNSHSGNKVLAMNSVSNDGAYSMAVLPMVEASHIQDLIVSLWVYCTASNGSLQVGLVSAPDDPATFQSVGSVLCPQNQWTRVVVPLADYAGLGSQLALLYSQPNGYMCYIDDVAVTTAAVDSVRVIAVTDNSATIEFARLGVSSAIVIEYGPLGFVPGTGILDTITDLSHSLTGLQPGTAYHYYLWPITDDDNSQCAAFRGTFTTLAESTVAPYCQKFDLTTFPQGWYRSVVYGNYPQVASGNYSGNCLQLRTYHYNGSLERNTSMATLPLLEEADLRGLSTRFVARSNSNNSQSLLVVGMMTHPYDTLTFTPVDTLVLNTSWVEYTVDLSSYSGLGRYLAFHYCNIATSSHDNYAYIDNLFVHRCDVSGVRVFGQSAHSATISWTASGNPDRVEVEYSIDGTPEGDGAVITDAQSPLTIEGLTPGTQYQYFIRAICSGSRVGCAQRQGLFATRTDSLGPGLCFDFDQSNSILNFWTRPSGYNSSYPNIISNTSNRYYTSAPSSLRFYHCGGSDTNLIVMPRCDVPLNGMALGMNLRVNTSDIRDRAVFTVGVCTLPFDAATFTPVATIYPTMNWSRYYVDLSQYTGSGRYIAFRYHSSNGCHETYLDDLSLYSCVAANPHVVDITDHSATLIYQHFGATPDSLQYTIEYGPAGFALGTGTLLHTADTSVSITGLQPNTTYDFYVRTSCQDSAACLLSSVSATTLDQPMTLPYCIGFDRLGTNLMPPGWIRPYGDTYPLTSSMRYRSASRSLQFATSSDRRSSMAVMPMIEIDDIHRVHLDFYYYLDNNSGQLQMGVMTNPYDTSTFVPVATYTSASSWRRAVVDLSTYAGSGRYVAFRLRYVSGGSCNAYLDDITLRTCAIQSLSMTGLVQNAVDINWTATSETQGLWLSINGGEPTFHTSNPIHVDGLMEATNYTFHLWPQCDSIADGCNYEVLTIRTQHPWVDAPYCNSFDYLPSQSYPDNWLRQSSYSTLIPQVTSNHSHSANNSLQFVASGNLFSQAVMPLINPNEPCQRLRNLYLDFWVNFYSAPAVGRLVVGIIENVLDTNSIFPIDTISASVSGWQHYTLPLSAYTGQSQQVVFKYYSATSGATFCAIDDVCLQMCVVSELNITEVTQHSVTVEFDAYGSNGIVVEYGPRGFTPGEGIFDTITTSPYTIDSLDELTEYMFNFTSLCPCLRSGPIYVTSGVGTGIGFGGGTGIVITTQAQNMDLPYCEPFEGYDTLGFPPSWRGIPGSSSQYPMITHTNHHGGQACLALYTTGGGAANYAVLPPVPEGQLSNVLLTFYGYCQNSGATSATSPLTVGVMTNPDDATTFTPVSTVRLSATSKWEQILVDFASYTGSGQYIAFRFAPTSSTSYTYYLDDIYVGTCAVTNVQFQPTPPTVQVSWTAHRAPQSVVIEYGPQGYDRNDPSVAPHTVTATSSPCTLTDIDPDSNYDFYIMPQCSGAQASVCSPMPYTLNPMLSVPYCQDFNDVVSPSLPEGWRVKRGNYSTLSQYLNVSQSSGVSSAGIILLPALSGGQSLAGKYVTVDFRTTYMYGAVVEFGVLTDTLNLNTFVSMGSIRQDRNNQWTTFQLQLSGYTGPQNRLAIRFSTTSTCNIYLDNFVLSATPSPINVRDSYNGFAQRHIYWDSTLANTHYDIEYSILHLNQWQRTSSDSCHALLTGLRPAQDYEYYFISPSGERLCHPFVFTTPDALPVPYCQDFETVAGTLCPDWSDLRYPYTSNCAVNISNTISYAGLRSMTFTASYSDRHAYAVMPDIDIDSLQRLTLSFMMRSTNCATTQLQLGVLTSPTNAATFQPLLTFRNRMANTWESQSATLRGLDIQGRYLAWRMVKSNNDWQELCLDNLSLDTCPMAPRFSVAGARQVRAFLPDSTLAPDYYVEVWEPEASAPDTLIHVTSNPYYITGLLPATTYLFYSRCDSLSSTCRQPAKLTTAASLSLPHCENFDNVNSGQIPSAWKRIANYSDIPCVSTGSYYSSARSVRFYNNRNYYSWLILPDMDLHDISSLSISLMMRTYTTLHRGGLVVGMLSDPADTTTFYPIDTLANTLTDWQPFSVNLGGYHGPNRFVAFKMFHVDANWDEIYIDNLVFESCPQPRITLSAATTVTCTLPDSVVPDYYIEYGPAPALQGDEGNIILHVTSNAYQITGLLPNTRYNFYPRCDSLVSTCRPATALATWDTLPLPYCQDFNAVLSGELPPLWRRITTYSTYPRIYTSYGVVLDYYGYDHTYREYAVLPDLGLPSISQASLSCQLYITTAAASLEVGVMTDPADTNTFQLITRWTNTVVNTWQPHTLSLAGYSGSGRFLALRYRHDATTGWSSVFVDSLFIDPCPAASLVRVSLADHNTVRCQADTLSDVDYWLRYGPADPAGDCLYSRSLHVTSNPFHLTGLSPDTTYRFFVLCDSASQTCRSGVSIRPVPLLELPYCDGFEAYSGSFPAGWRRINSNYITIDNTHYEGSRSLRLDGYSNQYSVCAIMPDLMVDSLRHVSLSFWHMANQASMQLEIGVLDNYYDMSTFQHVAYVSSPYGVWQHKSVSLASYRGQGRFIAFRYLSPVGGWYSQYIDNLVIDTCYVPASATVRLDRYNQVRVDWDTADHADTFFVEYGPQDFTPGTGTYVRCAANPTRIAVSPNTTYDFYLVCDSLSTSCRQCQRLTSGIEPLEVPLCLDFDSYTSRNVDYNMANGADLPPGWGEIIYPNTGSVDCGLSRQQSHTSPLSLRFYSYYSANHPCCVLPDLNVDSLSQLAVSFWMYSANAGALSLELGVMSDPHDISSFIPIKTFVASQSNVWQRHTAVLTDAPADAHYIAFRFNNAANYSSNSIYLDDLFITTCGADNFHVATPGSDFITFTWSQVGSPATTVEYGPQGFARGSGTTVVATQPPFTISGLNPLTNYDFYFDAQCGDAPSYCNTDYSAHTSLFTPAGGMGCIDPTSLTASYTSCTYGSYTNPRQYQGVVDYGPASMQSRHTVHFDTTELDPRTGSLLRTVPQGTTASVRLGNWNVNASQPQAESVTYSLFVDTASFDLLLLRYAAVLQDPEHSAAQQPRFSIEILDDSNHVIDATCGAADFIADASLGWNQAANNVLWKDWTTVGLDMSAYADRVVRIRLTTYDCGEGSHYGYAYFTLGCLLKNIVSDHCGDVAENTFTVPSGFAYNWYTDTVTRASISHEQTITLPSTNTVYYCDLSFIDNADCYFTMSAYAGTRYPMALFDSVVSVSQCQFQVQFLNRSTISADGVNPLPTGEGCESAFWDFGNGTTSTDYNPTVTYTHPGTYQVMLVSSIGGGQCADTLVKTLHLSLSAPTPYLTGVSQRCANHLPDSLCAHHGISYLWSTGSTDSVILVAPTTDSAYTCIVADTNGCLDTLSHTVHVAPVYQIADTLQVCSDQLPLHWADTVIADVPSLSHHTLHRTTLSGCDSLLSLQLTVRPLHHTDTVASVCDSLLWYGTAYHATPAVNPTHVLHNQYGCDSTLALHLTVLHSSHTWVSDTVLYRQLPHQFMSFTLSSDTALSVVLPNAQGCDSVIHYHLHVLRNTSATLYDTVCASQLPYQWHHRTFAAAGSQADTLVNAAGADSLLTLVLHVLPTYHHHVYDTICNHQTFTFEDSAYTTSGLYTHSLSTATHPACDSLRTLHLTVLDTSLVDTVALVCDTFSWHGRHYTQSATDTLAGIYLNARGCDSTVVLRLTVRHSTAATVRDTCLQNLLPRTFHGLVLWSDTADARVTIPNLQGCDSLIHYHLHVLRNTSATLYDTVCASQLPYQWHHRTFAAAGSQPDTLVNAAGADSLVTLVLHVLPSYHHHVYDTICNHQTLTFEDSAYTASGLYTHRLSTATHPACDSLRTLHLHVIDTIITDTVASVCDRISWRGATYTSSVVARVSHNASQPGQCDSTFVLHLTVRHSSAADTLASVCDSLPWHGTTFTAVPDTVPTYRLSNAQGCDSTVSLHLTLRHSHHLSETDTLCPNTLAAGYPWHDTTLFTLAPGGRYQLPRTSQQGCDSITTLDLTLLANTSSIVRDTIVQNAAATWQFQGLSFSSDTADALVTIPNHLGCDSVIHYHLHIWPNVSTVVDTFLCDDALPTFQWHGLSFADTLTALLSTTHGADSLVTLIAHVRPTYHTLLSDTLCQGMTYALADSLYSQSGTYHHTFATQHGCDSLVSLQLTVHPVYSLTFHDTIYSGDTAWFQGQPFTTAGSYPVTLATVHGCDSVLVLHLVEINLEYVTLVDTICQGQSVDFFGRQLTASGSYTDTIHTGAQLMLDTVVTLHLTVLPYPQVQIHSTPRCRDYVCYELQALPSDAYTYRWAADPYSPSLNGHDRDTLVRVQPTVPTVYTLTAGYGPTFRCATTDSILLQPLYSVQAHIDASRSMLTSHDHEFTARNASTGTYTHTEWEVWFDHMLQTVETDAVISVYAPLTIDSVNLVLRVSNDICADTDTVSIPVVLSSLFFPNIFTPNLTTNNRFYGVGEGILNYELWIYDRFGDLVFHTTDIHQSWDGTHQGQPCPQNTYVYKCRYTDLTTPNGSQTLTGTVTLIR